MLLFLLALLFIFGSGIGSFLNVVSLRYQPERNLLSPKIIGGRSHCPHCGKTLSWFELAPIFSFVFQLGRCRNCKQKISWQYPIVESLSGLIFVFIPLQFLKDFTAVSASAGLFNIGSYELISIILWIFIFELFLLLSVIDLRLFIIPDGINISLAGLGLGLIVLKNYFGRFGDLDGSFLKSYALLAGFRENIWLNYTLAAGLAMVFFGLIIILSRGRAMGWGDFKLVGALGLIFGWPDIILAVALSFIIGSLLNLPLILGGRKKMKDPVPFGPYLVLASGLVFFFGYYIINGYFKIFNFGFYG